MPKSSLGEKAAPSSRPGPACKEQASRHRAHGGHRLFCVFFPRAARFGLGPRPESRREEHPWAGARRGGGAGPSLPFPTPRAAEPAGERRWNPAALCAVRRESTPHTRQVPVCFARPALFSLPLTAAAAIFFPPHTLRPLWFGFYFFFPWDFVFILGFFFVWLVFYPGGREWGVLLR